MKNLHWKQGMMILSAIVVIIYGMTCGVGIRIIQSFRKKPKKFHCECERCGYITTKYSCPYWLGRED